MQPEVHYIAPARHKVLVVEDHPDAAKLMARLLSIWGHDPSIAHDAPTALALARRELPRVMLVDIGLPEMDGYQLAREIRRLPDLSITVLIALTGFVSDDDHRLAIESGFDQFFAKPVDLKLLRDTLAGISSVSGHR
jgi:CheY-like chemotaxis protein